MLIVYLQSLASRCLGYSWTNIFELETVGNVDIYSTGAEGDFGREEDGDLIRRGRSFENVNHNPELF